MGEDLVGTGLGADPDPAQDAFDALQKPFKAAAEKMLDEMRSKSDRIKELADESRAHAAEATRQAWLAHEACGGELPEDFPDVENPFDSGSRRIPDWSSTFWDISSP